MISQNNGVGLLPLLAILCILLSIVLVLTTVRDNSQVVKVEVPDGLNSKGLPEGSYWACSSIICDKFYEADEWVKQFCQPSDDGLAVCRAATPQGNFLIPLSEINVSAVKECKEYRCVQQALVKNVSYSISP